MPIGSLSTGRGLAVFAVGPDGSLANRCLIPDSGWSEWSVVCPQVRGAPAAFQNADGRVEVFAAGADGRLGHAWEIDAGRWSDWEGSGPPVLGDPCMFIDQSGRLQVFAAGADGQLGRMRQLEPGGLTGWSEWETSGHLIRGRPTAFQNFDGRLEVFAAGIDGRLGHIWEWEPGGPLGWAEWDDFHYIVRGNPVAFQNDDGRLEVFACNAQGRLGHVWQLDPGGHTGWSEWGDFGYLIRGDPAVGQNPDGRLEVFGCGSGGRLGHVWRDHGGRAAGWSEWGDFGYTIAETPTVFHNADGRLDVFVVRLDGRLGHVWQQGPGAAHPWSDWADLGAGWRLPAVCRASVSGRAGSEQLAAVVQRARAAWPVGTATTLTADVCVVGGGPAGITLSDALTRAGASVLLLESGEWDYNPAAQELNDADADGPIIKDYRNYLRAGRQRQIQGAALRWGRGLCMPLRTLDFEDRAWVPHSGWPLVQADLAPFEKLAAATFGFDEFGPPATESELVHLSYHYPSNPLLFRALFLQLLTRPNFATELGATVVELKVGGDRVTGVRVARAGGDELHVEADTVVLAGGAVENTRLLLMHERSVPSGGNAGRFFMEHPHVLAGSVELADPTPLRACLADGAVREVLALPEEVQRTEHLLNVSVQLSPHGSSGATTPLTCQLYARAEQAPNPESRVVLGDQLDRLGCPRPRLEWRLSEQDWISVVRTSELVAAALEERYGARTELLVRTDEPWPWPPAGPADSSNATWGNHHLGTTRMAVRPEDGVVDPDCRVHGTENLFVAGSSVFPTGGCANPTFTIVTLAHRLASHLASR
jgi:peptide methionine sulfoxide reductase MsrB